MPLQHNALPNHFKSLIRLSASSKHKLHEEDRLINSKTNLNVFKRANDKKAGSVTTINNKPQSAKSIGTRAKIKFPTTKPSMPTTSKINSNVSRPRTGQDHSEKPEFLYGDVNKDLQAFVDNMKVKHKPKPLEEGRRVGGTFEDLDNDFDESSDLEY